MKVTQVRNYEFHKKMFALFQYAFDIRNPCEELAAKSFDRFRKDLTILAGHYEQTVRLNGEIRTEAKSLAFQRMDEEEFAELYGHIIDVVVKYVCREYTGESLRAILQEVEAFDG